MKALLLSAGLGTRFKPITNTIPKCLVPIQGIPLIDYWFDLVFENGTERALLDLHHHASLVAEHVKVSQWSHLVDLVYEDQLLGTAGTIKENLKYFNNSSFLVAHSDNLTTFNVNDFIFKIMST